MFYVFGQDGFEKIQVDDITKNQIIVGYLTKEEFKTSYNKLEISESSLRECMLEQIKYRTSVDVYDDFSFGVINIIDVLHIRNQRDCIAFFMKKNLFLLVEILDEDGSTKEMFEESLGRFNQNITLEKVIYSIMDKLLLNGTKAMEEAEGKILDMEQVIVDGRANEKMNSYIFHMKNQLTIQKNYYEQLIDIGEVLQENENEIFEENNLRYFKIFTDKASRLSNNTKMLCESLVHLREAYEASLEYNLNRIMKMFTVVTTIFLPLTLIVGWYGMNFSNMPELNWKYGYFAVIIVSIIVVIICIWIFKKKKFF